ncbi:MAG TPA: RHS repeat-associated core domain-containing protein, partial [Mucilaginibacter sp.]|nr:RHS repeat-associated core domain-containing protein [Mucilaginibacter sp.]
LPSTGGFDYYYYLGDNLGNTRVMFDSQTSPLTPVQSDDYYPFGLEIHGANMPSLKNEYLYNKKELQEEIKQYDYGARFYDPVIGRFTTIDRFAEKYRTHTPYHYGLNNPTGNIDIHGDSVNMALIKQYDNTNSTHINSSVMGDLAPETGLNLSENANGQMEYAKDEKGQPILNYEDDGNGGIREVGSATARNALIKAIDNSTTAYVRAGTNSSSIVGGTLIKLDPTQIDKFISGTNNLDAKTLGYGMTFLHEMIHSLLGGSLTDPPVSAGFGPTGATVDKMNIIRSELNQKGANFGQRSSYQGIVLSVGGAAYLPFNTTSLNSLQGGNPPNSTDPFISYTP